MASGSPLAELPDEVTFSLDEVADILFVVDLAVASVTPGSDDYPAARRVQRLITARLWPDLGAMLEDEQDEDG